MLRKPVHLTPALGISILALFFALGGSAFALGTKVVPQPKCAQGAVRGIVEVTGQVGHGVANLPDSYITDPTYFGRKWSCSGGAIQARRLSTGQYDVKFVGNAATSALVSGQGNAAATDIARSSDGSFHITVGTPTNLDDVPFTIVVF